MKRFGYVALAIGAAMVLIALVVGGGTTGAAAATQQNGPIVALVYDANVKTLFKASAHELQASDDGGRSWRAINVPGLEGGEIASLAASLAGKDVMYVAGPGIGLLRSEDGGKTWEERDQGLPKRDVIAVAAHTTQPETVYVVLPESGVYRSQDAGKTWRLMDRGMKGGIRQLIHTNMAGSMQTGWLFAATPKGVRRAMDCFCLWEKAGNLGSYVRSLTFDPKQPNHLYAATDQGLLRSTDGGETWAEMKSPGPDLVGLTFGRSGTLYAIGRDGILFRSANEGKAWTPTDA